MRDLSPEEQALWAKVTETIRPLSREKPRHAEIAMIAPAKPIPPPIARKSKGPLHLVLDSTGLKVHGEGGWKARKYGYSRRRTWLKLHLAIDPETWVGLDRQKFPLWLTSTCQMVGLCGTMPASRTAPMRALWPLPTGAGPAAVLGAKTPGPRKVRVPPGASTMIESPARKVRRTLSGSERPGG